MRVISGLKQTPYLTRIIHTKSHCEPEPKARAWQSLNCAITNKIAEPVLRLLRPAH